MSHRPSHDLSLLSCNSIHRAMREKTWRYFQSSLESMAMTQDPIDGGTDSIYKAYLVGLCSREYPSKIWPKNMVLTYLQSVGSWRSPIDGGDDWKSWSYHNSWMIPGGLHLFWETSKCARDCQSGNSLVMVKKKGPLLHQLQSCFGLTRTLGFQPAFELLFLDIPLLGNGFVWR